jgi:hypothetical protein
LLGALKSGELHDIYLKEGPSAFITPLFCQPYAFSKR